MDHVTLLLSMPGGAEWLIMIIGIPLLASPVLAIVFYSQVQQLKKENQELRNILNRK